MEPSTNTIPTTNINLSSNFYDKLTSSSKSQQKHSLSQNTNPPSNSTNKIQYQNKSFAETTANIKYPKMNQAIVLNSIDGLKQIQYIIALSNITDATNIISASRISNNRFCIFLKNEIIVDSIISNHSYIKVDDIVIPIRKLINPFKRIILSNVYPSIPNEAITDRYKNIYV